MTDIANLKSGFGGALAAGQRPALLVIDFQRGFTDPSLSPLASNCTGAIAATNQLISHVRPHGPVIFTVCSYSPTLRDAGLWSQKCSSLSTLLKGTEACDLDPELDSHNDDLVIEKTQASAFFGTPVAAILTSMGIDTLYISGCTTSGCIRASVVDAMQHGFPPFVVKEACTDRSQRQHESNMIDMQDKYAEVVGINTAIEQLGNINK